MPPYISSVFIIVFRKREGFQIVPVLVVILIGVPHIVVGIVATACAFDSMSNRQLLARTKLDILYSAASNVSVHLEKWSQSSCFATVSHFFAIVRLLCA